MREVEREGPSHYGEILKQSLNGADFWRMQVDEGGDLARRRQEQRRARAVRTLSAGTTLAQTCVLLRYRGLRGPQSRRSRSSRAWRCEYRTAM